MRVRAALLRPAPAQLRVGCPALGAVVVSPWTRYDFDGSLFLPAAGSIVAHGRVDVSGAALVDAATDAAAAWSVATFDVDGAVQRLQEAATASADADLTALPPLRSAGLVLMHGERGVAFDARARRGRDAPDRDLDADDLVLGYRVDIKPRGMSWRSLHERLATYTVDHTTPVGAPNLLEEGHLKPFAGSRRGDDGPLQADEVVARWDGWSLAVRPPELLPSHERARRVHPAGMPFDFGWVFSVPDRSLPTLRFGRTYRIRLRLADAAGGGLRLDDIAADAGATEEVTYLRLEPIPPPLVVPPAAFGPGAAALSLVIRSDPASGLNTAAFAAAHPGAVTTDARRRLRPPTTTKELAEQHGVLDGADEATWELAKRALAQGRVRADGGPVGLPDPSSGGVVASARPTQGGLALALVDDRAWTGAWPALDDKVVEVVESPAGAGASIRWSDDNLLHVELAPAAEALVELSSFMKEGVLDQFEIKRWLAAFPAADATGGLHPMVTPPEVVHCVHAVRTPLRMVSGALTAAPRQPAATYAVLSPARQLDAASTGQIDLDATWTDLVDDPSLPGPPAPITAAGPVTSITVARGQDGLPLGPP